MISAGVQLLVVGLGVVFLFLGLLVLVLQLVARFAAEPPAEEAGGRSEGCHQALVAAAIAVAAARLRRTKGR